MLLRSAISTGADKLRTKERSLFCTLAVGIPVLPITVTRMLLAPCCVAVTAVIPAVGFS